MSESSWSLDSIKDDVFRTKFNSLPSIISEWIVEYFHLSGKDILDFGCGDGATALGLALQYRPSRVVGVDIGPDIAHCLSAAKSELGLLSLPGNLELHRVNPGCLHDTNDSFDVIYSWSVFEHIDTRLINRVTELLYKSLKPDGIMFVQIAPLYYSAEGSHLFKYIKEPWGHLLHPTNVYYDKLSAADDVNEDLQKSLWATYTTLNRITSSNLERLFEENHFEIIRKYTTLDEYDPPELLTEIYSHDVLTTDQIVLLLKKKAPS